MNSDDDIDRAAIEAHAQRVAEQAALRNVRKALDAMREDETSKRRTLHKVLIVCAVLVGIGTWFVWGLVFSGKDLPKEPPMKVPGTLQPKQ